MKHARRAQGQALTEFLVASFALIPLFLLVPIIAKYQDIAHSTQLASRYVAFEATNHNDAMNSWKPEDQLAGEIRRRFFSNSNAPIKTYDTPGNFMAHQNLFWRGPTGEALIADFDSDVQVTFGTGNGTTHSDAFQSTSDGELFLLRSPLGLESRGIYTANVAVRLANLPAGLKSYEPFDAINLVIARGTSVLIDPWTSNSPAQTDARVGGSPIIFPSGTLQAVSPIVNADVAAIDVLGGVQGPQLGQIDFWQDLVPEDRLK
jgi:hypothetical protein